MICFGNPKQRAAKGQQHNYYWILEACTLGQSVFLHCPWWSQPTLRENKNKQAEVEVQRLTHCNTWSGCLILFVWAALHLLQHCTSLKLSKDSGVEGKHCRNDTALQHAESWQRLNGFAGPRVLKVPPWRMVLLHFRVLLALAWSQFIIG